jgi:hypothetical protein
MYLWIWHLLPGGKRLKTASACVLLASVIAVCFLWLFPLISELTTRDGSTLRGASSGSSD